ncbi:probable kinase anchor protein 7 isoform gamma [Coccomyxa sp. Obi]|nr:probable kinase anchor protein 7 isoform gamma [Coccomyxa sp. Obi]
MDDVVLTDTGVLREFSGVEELCDAEAEPISRGKLQASDQPHESERKKPKIEPELPKVPVVSPLHSPSDVKRIAKKRPTHFVAARVSHSPSVTKAIETVQEALRLHNPALHGAFVEPVTSHLTLLVMPLDGAERLQAAQQAMEALQTELGTHGLMGPVSLDVAGLSHFRRQVLYLDVVKDDGHDKLMALAAATRSHFLGAGLLDGDDGRPFTAHVTVAKLSNLMKGKRGKHLRTIPEEAYSDLIMIDGGSVTVSELQLCRMGGRAKGAYYHVEASVEL